MLNSVTVPSLWDENKAKGLDEPGLLDALLQLAHHRIVLQRRRFRMSG